MKFLVVWISSFLELVITFPFSKLTGSDVDLLSLNSPKTRTKITRPIKTLTAKLVHMYIDSQGYKCNYVFKGHKIYLLHLKSLLALTFLNELNRMMT